mgnify:CR=1 FL=1
MVKRFDYDRTNFFKAIMLLHEYQVGDEFFTLKDNKVIPVTLYQVELTYLDHGLTHTVKRELSIKVELICLYGGSSKMTITPANLFRTREEAAEAFLDRNDIPKKLLQVLNPPKPRTTIGDLIEKLQIVDPEIDLGDSFWKILKPITQRIENPDVQTTDEYWDCECEHNYIHPAAHTWCHKCKAHKEEMPSSRVEEVLEGKEMFFTEDADENNTDDE